MFSEKTAPRETKQGQNILVVRLGAMGDVLHTLPAAASLKHNFPAAQLTWAVDSLWAPLLRANPFIDRIVEIDRKRPGTWGNARRELHRHRFSLAVDFQGLLKSAFLAFLARPERIFGFDSAQLRERAAALFYSQSAAPGILHAVDRNLALAQAAGAVSLLRTFPLPPGRPEGLLPKFGFVLANPLAGWAGKQWPLEYYAELAKLLKRELNLPLVVNGPPSSRAALEAIPGAVVHVSGIDGLIDGTRRATAVLGVDSGPMHLAAALNKPGIAIFGPTDPARNGPYGGSLQILRDSEATPKFQRGDTRSGAYLRGADIDPGMRAIKPSAVLASLKAQVACPA
ncbi:MAG: glycosyltransferase family 9 protein [Acidobacteriota bacterium]|nr:glycosyltransferase family 9 protein [Acidobacteriota bacterium]